MRRVPHTLSLLPDIPDIRTVIGVIAGVAVTCIIFVGLRSMGEWCGFVDKGITMGPVAICVGIDVGAISSVTMLPHQAARSMI
jgi:hypothetical protein